MARVPTKTTMAKQKRRRFSAEFKARVAIEATRGVKTINEIAADNEVHPVQVSQWKRELLERAPEVFAGAAKARRDQKSAEEREGRLERKVGQLAVELDWLQKKSEELGL